MFTIEHVADGTVVTILDTEGQMEDVECIFDDQGIWIRQFDNQQNEHDLVFMQHNQWSSLMAALQCPEGVYQLKDTHVQRSGGTSPNP